MSTDDDTGTRGEGDGAALPYPDSDLSPALQRTIKAKIDRGEIDEVDADVFYGAMRQTAKAPKERSGEAS